MKAAPDRDAALGRNDNAMNYGPLAPATPAVGAFAVTEESKLLRRGNTNPAAALS